MRLARLLATPLPALLDRARQEIRRRLDRVLVEHGRTGWPLFPALAHLSPRPGRSPEAASAAWLRAESGSVSAVRRPGRFFTGPLDARVAAALRQYDPSTCARLLAAADKACEGRFDLLGYASLSFGHPPDWHFDPVNGKRAGLRHWSVIDPLDPEEAGDSKVIWELNRHQWLVTLGQAYRLSGDERYVRAFVDNLRAWMAANRPGTGINWSSSLEVALRIISWSWAMALFASRRTLPLPFADEIPGWIRAHAAHVYRYTSGYFSPNTHLTVEALGLYYAGVLYPSLPGARRWLASGRRILLQQLLRQVFPDGVYFEQSTCYQRYTAEIYLHFLILSRLNGIALPPIVADKVTALLDWLLAVRHPGGGMPQIGDADGGWLLPLVQRDQGDLRGLFGLAAAHFGRAEYAWAADGEYAEAAWVFGAKKYCAVRNLEPHPPVLPASRSFPNGGYVVMRGDWGKSAHQLILDAGPLGCRFSAGHGHADLLAVQCAAFGRPQIVDPGTGSYGPDALWRNHFRSSLAHGTVSIDGEEQASPAGPFAWRSRPRAKLREFDSAPGFDYADAEHFAYRRLADPVLHRRRVLFLKPRYWLLIDDLSGRAEHEVSLRFQFAPSELMESAAGWVRAGGEDGRGLYVRPFAPVPLTLEVLKGSLAPLAGWVSPRYGVRLPAPLLNWHTRTNLPLRVVSLIVPSAAAAPPAFDVDFESPGTTRIRSADETVLVDSDDVSIEYPAFPAAGRPRGDTEVRGPACAA